MKPEIKQKWVTALRSGEYKQGRGVLHYINKVNGVASYCCLGVLCAIAAEEGIVEPVHDALLSYITYDGDRYILPEAVQEWAGVTQGGKYTDGNSSDDLIRLNDTGESFYDIADVIEEHF